jgi:superfamily II RNA helicase
MVVEKNYDPVIVFSFSKRECESLVNQLEKIDLCDEDEKKLVDTIYWASLVGLYSYKLNPLDPELESAWLQPLNLEW